MVFNPQKSQYLSLERVVLRIKDWGMYGSLASHHDATSSSERVPRLFYTRMEQLSKEAWAWHADGMESMVSADI